MRRARRDSFAFVSILAEVSVADEALQAGAVVASVEIDAVGVDVTHVQEALIDIRAVLSVACETVFATADMGTVRVGAIRILATVILAEALVDIFTGFTVTGVSVFAGARVRTREIFAKSIFRACKLVVTLVHVVALNAVADVSVNADTIKRALYVETLAIYATVMISSFALVEINAVSAFIEDVANEALTLVTSKRVLASSALAAWLVDFALIDVVALAAFLRESNRA